jgi:S-adenosylhomocysteine hydrolase
MIRASSQFLSHAGLQPSFFSPMLSTVRRRHTDLNDSFDTREKLRRIAAHYVPFSKKPLKDCMVVGIQHMLETTVDMFAVMQELGLERAIVGGKHYSTNKACIAEFEALGPGFRFIESPKQWGYGGFDRVITQTADQAWAEAITQLEQKPTKILLAIDDGADLLLRPRTELFNGFPNKPDCVMGVEQTRGGSNQEPFTGLPFPVIDVAGAAVKLEIEYPKVAKIVAEKVLDEVQKHSHNFRAVVRVGIVGYGTMGQAIANALIPLGFKVLVYDKLVYDKKGSIRTSEKALTFYEHVGPLCSHADIIVGCTGNDITVDPIVLESIEKSSHDKVLISTSSKDTEFKRLLTRIQINKASLVTDPRSDLSFTTSTGGEVVICRGGFPINFDNARHSVAPEHIWPTRACLLTAALMGAHLCNDNSIRYRQQFSMIPLDPEAQKLILDEYKQDNPDLNLNLDENNMALRV